MTKDIQNADALACKLGPISIKTINHRLEVAKKEQGKREKMVKKRKTKTMTVKCHRNRRRNSLSSREKGNYQCEIGDNTNSDQVDNKYPL